MLYVTLVLLFFFSFLHVRYLSGGGITTIELLEYPKRIIATDRCGTHLIHGYKISSLMERKCSV